MSTKATRLGYLSGNQQKGKEHRFDFVEPCFENMDWFFQEHAEWLDVETDISHESFTYTGHGTFDQDTIHRTELVPVLKLGRVSVNRFVEDGECLEDYYDYAWNYLKVGNLILEFIDDLEELETLKICTTDDGGAVTWDAVKMLYNLYSKDSERKTCLTLAVERAGLSVVDSTLVLACAETLRHRGIV